MHMYSINNVMKSFYNAHTLLMLGSCGVMCKKIVALLHCTDMNDRKQLHIRHYVSYVESILTILHLHTVLGFVREWCTFFRRSNQFVNSGTKWDVDDHSRVRLQRHNVDYINASLVEVPEADRAYILTQVCGQCCIMCLIGDVAFSALTLLVEAECVYLCVCLESGQ